MDEQREQSETYGSTSTSGRMGGGYGGVSTESRGAFARERERAAEALRRGGPRTLDAADRAAKRAQEASRAVRSRVGEAVGGGKHMVAKELRALGEAAGAAASQLQEQQHPETGRYLHQATDYARRAADYLEECDPADLAEDVRHMARRNPALFIAGAVLVGFALGRFLSATAPDKPWDGMDEGEEEGARNNTGGYSGSTQSGGGLAGGLSHVEHHGGAVSGQGGGM